MGRLSRHVSTIRIHPRDHPPVAPLMNDLANSELVQFFETRMIGFCACFALGMLAHSLYYQQKNKPNKAKRAISSGARFYTLRLTPKVEIKAALETFVKENDIHAGAIVSCAGSTENAILRLSNAKAGDDGTFLEMKRPSEIVSLSGTVSKNGMHIHIALGDENGMVHGGHLISAIVNTTCEIVLAELTEIQFDRKMDRNTGYKELEIVQ